MSRRTKLTEETKTAFLQAIRLGCPIKDACGCAGISEATYYVWQNRADAGGSGSKPFIEFFEEVKKARGEGTRTWLAIIEKAAREGSWQAAAWKLERRRGMVAKQKYEVEATVDAKVTLEKRKQRLRSIMKDPEAAAAAAILAKALETGT